MAMETDSQNSNPVPEQPQQTNQESLPEQNPQLQGTNKIKLYSIIGAVVLVLIAGAALAFKFFPMQPTAQQQVQAVPSHQGAD